MKCENEECSNIVSAENFQRVCAGNTDMHVETSMHGYNNYRVCSCCNDCRQKCINESIEDDK